MLQGSSGSEETLLLACSGGSNVGQITNEAARMLAVAGRGRMYCAIGVGAGLDSFVSTTAEAATVVALDGCPVCCVKNALENADLQADVHVVVTELGIEKQPGFDTPAAQVDTVVAAVAESLPGGSGGGCGCCCR